MISLNYSIAVIRMKTMISHNYSLSYSYENND